MFMFRINVEYETNPLYTYTFKRTRRSYKITSLMISSEHRKQHDVIYTEMM
ncbi:hypothetical protein Hesp017 [Hemileuca sp. nucleopolyhedrovirus]|uniref:Uncharacterized protein n=1 Tax=Hemileuca sp. nucleopolyhedrovirus TaxID=1367203 RepID=S5MQ86_9ABAC|nr:hypothetical protein Hesp017 [Hemileuca sp. nucleopolyhedrovirus]AGR56769.1 hypothetical protein Hesp017 [Hemileuca sp. nucleopolyhedrovirus]